MVPSRAEGRGLAFEEEAGEDLEGPRTDDLISFGQGPTAETTGRMSMLGTPSFVCDSVECVEKRTKGEKTPISPNISYIKSTYK